MEWKTAGPIPKISFCSDIITGEKSIEALFISIIAFAILVGKIKAAKIYSKDDRISSIRANPAGLSGHS